MNIEEINKALEWSPEEKEELLAMKQNKANKLLLDLIMKGDEEGAFLLAFDKSVEVNGSVSSSNYKAMNEAIYRNFLKFVEESFNHSDFESKLQNGKYHGSIFYQNLAISNSPEMYELIERREKNENKIKLLGDTLFYSLGMGQLKLIKYLINKQIEGQYIPLDMRQALDGYSSISIGDKNYKDNLFEYASYFANIEKETKNNYINEETKKLFFSEDLLPRIVSREDDRTLSLYINMVSPEQVKKDIDSCIQMQQTEIKRGEPRLTEQYQWLFLNLVEMNVDISLPKDSREILRVNPEINEFYEKVQLTNKMQHKLPHRENNNKKIKI